MIRQTLSCVSWPEYLFNFTSCPTGSGDGAFGRACLAVWVECYNEQGIDLTAHIWTSGMAVTTASDSTPLARLRARLERPGSE